LGLLCEAGMVGVETSLDARHEVFVVILQSHDARPRCSNYPAPSAAAVPSRQGVRTLGNIDVTSRKAVEGGQRRGHLDAML
jgi:hypothetical protein